MEDRVNTLALVNGKIVSPLGIHDSLVVKGNKIEYVGRKDEALEIAGKNAKVINLKGYTVLPGFIDAHMHLLEFSLSLRHIDLRNVSSIQELKAKIYEKAKSLGPGEWILGRGWDQELFTEKRWPTRYDIDEVAPKNPVILWRICGHIAVVNTLALRKAGIDKNTPDPPGGVIDRDEKGEPTGVLKESAIELIRRIIPSPSFKDYLNALKRGVQELLSHGITTVHFVSCTKEAFELLRYVLVNEGLPIRVRVYFSSSHIDYAVKISQKLGKNSILKVSGIKIMADGSLGGRTAYLKEPYADYPGRGLLTINKKKLREILEKTRSYGLQAAVHAIGDAAIEETLKAYEDVGVTPKERFRVEHASLLSSELMNFMSRLGIVAVVQPHFIISDWWVVQRVGKERARWVYPFKSLLNSKINVAFSTDAPVEPIDPWLTLQAAITRGEELNIELARYTQSERLNLGEALKCYTQGSAYASFDETLLGTIMPGKLADLIVVDTNPFELNPNEITKIKVLMTIVDGNIVYSSSF